MYFTVGEYFMKRLLKCFFVAVDVALAVSVAMLIINHFGFNITINYY